jgi:hypothetical protein
LFLPLVQPAAVLREGDPNGVCGFYITETSDRIYLARSDLESDANRRPESNTGRIFWIPRKEVTALAIGRLQSVRNARRRAPLLRQELLAQRAPQFIARSESTDTTTEQTVADLKTTKKTSNSSKIPERVPDAASTAKSDTCSDVDF